MSIGKEEKNPVTYDQLIAGALLKFDSLDNLDISLIIEDFEKKENIKIENTFANPQKFFKMYFKTFKDGTTKLKDGMSLTDHTNYNCNLGELIQQYAGDIVDNYFKNFNMRKFNREKEASLLKQKEIVLDKANVLLISDMQEDYDELKRYGFKNVDFFKSIIRADKYFSEHPEELQKYHIILKGNQNVQKCCFNSSVDLDNKISLLREDPHVLVVNYYTWGKKNHSVFEAHLWDYHKWRNWYASEQTYTDFFDKIVEGTLIIHSLDKERVKDELFVPIKDYINPNRLPLPTKKSDLKILYLKEFLVSDYAYDIAEKLGLNITFLEDNNSTLGKYVKNNLGDYDIIIASKLFSRNLVDMNIESCEQSKDTGRELTLLVSYEDKSLKLFDEDKNDYKMLGSEIFLKYSFGGILANDLESHNKNFRVLGKPVDFISEDIGGYLIDDIACMTGIISAAISEYNAELLRMNKPPIKDMDIKTVEEFDEEYESVEKEIEERKEIELSPIKRFDDIRNTVSRYLGYKNSGLITENPEGLNITEGKKGIRVENIDQGKTISAITILNGYKKNTLRVFTIQTLLGNGNLSKPETIGLYTKKYEENKRIPKRPSKRQEDTLLALYRKIDAVLCPLNDEACNKQKESYAQNTKVLKIEQKKESNK